MKPDIPSPNKFKNGKPQKFSINFKRLGLMLTKPNRVFEEIQDENQKYADWKSPILVVGIIILIAGLLMVTNTTSSTSSQSSSSGLSLDFSSLTQGGMQGGGQMGMGGPNQAAPINTDDESSTDDTTTQTTSSSSTLLSRILSALGGLLSFLITWLLLGLISNLLSVSFGGQGNTKMSIVLAAWSCVPLGIRSMMQILYLLATGSSINAVGLSGFAPATETNMAIFLEKLLSYIDIYIFWQAFLLAVGIKVATKLESKKAVLITIISIILILLIKSLLGLGIEKISGISLDSSMLSGLTR